MIEHLTKTSEISDYDNFNLPGDIALWDIELKKPNSEVAIYTDGCCIGNPGPGGYAAVIVAHGHNMHTIAGSNVCTTNNVMELKAAIEALKIMRQFDSCKVIMIADSRYVIDGINVYLQSWKNTGWRKSNGKPVKNKELWIELDALNVEFGDRIKWKWTRSHAGDEFNVVADLMAKKQAEQFIAAEAIELARMELDS